MNKKILSLCIASAMLLSALPTTVFAASVGSTDTDKSIGSDSVQNQQTQYANFHESNAETEVYLTVDDSELLVSVPSTVILDGTPNDNGQYIGKYSVGVKGDMAGNKVVTVEPDTSTVSLRQDGKINNDATISQTQTDFNTDDFRDETVTDGTITATGLTAGSWNSEFNFNISISKNEIPAGYTVLYQYDLSATEADDVKAYYAVPIKNTTPIDVPSQQSEKSAASTYSLKTRTLNANAAESNVVEYNGVRYELSDEDTLVISGTGNMKENLSEELCDYRKLLNDVENQFGIKCCLGSEYESLNDGEECYLFSGNSVYPNWLITVRNGSICDWYDVPDEVKTYIDSIKDNYLMSLPSSIIIRDGVTNISNKAFLNNNDLVSITIPNSVVDVGNSAFERCRNLKNINLPNNLKNIGDNAFCGCINLLNITIPDGVTSIGSSAFEGCSSLTNITIPDSIAEIRKDTFYGCYNLTNVVIPNSVTTIQSFAFGRCESIDNLVIPDSVTSISSSAFNNVINVLYNGTASGSPWGAKVINGYACDGLVYKDESQKELLGCKLAATDITIPNSVTSISRRAFDGCSKLTNVTIPNSVTSIGSGAFYGCSSLTSITIPNNVASIDASTFNNCTSLTNVTIPNSVTNIAENAFYNCSNLTNVTIPNSVTSIGSSAFKSCTSLTSVTIPSSVKTIGENAFQNCTSLINVTIPNSVTSIGRYTFNNCTSLTNVTIPNSVTSIGEQAFYNCSSLTNVTIPNSVTSIDRNAFENCTNLTNVTIPNSVKSVGIFAFYNLSPGSTIYCQSQAVADLLKILRYTEENTTVVVDASKFE